MASCTDIAYWSRPFLFTTVPDTKHQAFALAFGWTRGTIQITSPLPATVHDGERRGDESRPHHPSSSRHAQNSMMSICTVQNVARIMTAISLVDVRCTVDCMMRA